MALKEVWEIAGGGHPQFGWRRRDCARPSQAGSAKCGRASFLETDRARYASELERLKTDLDRTTRLLQGEIEKTLFRHKDALRDRIHDSP